MPDIEIVDESPEGRPGVTVIDALVGPCRNYFEIRDIDGQIRYLVGRLEVSHQVYLAALQTASVDRFDPNDPEYQRNSVSDQVRNEQEGD